MATQNFITFFSATSLQFKNNSVFNFIALSMISNRYSFQIFEINPSKSRFANCRVVAVVINESDFPELLLLEEGFSDPHYYPIERLSIFSPIPDSDLS